jgi:hypothetical protein
MLYIAVVVRPSNRVIIFETCVAHMIRKLAIDGHTATKENIVCITKTLPSFLMLQIKDTFHYWFRELSELCTM